MTYYNPSENSSFSTPERRHPAGRITEITAYIGSISTTFIGYGASYSLVALEALDREMGLNAVPDKVVGVATAAALTVGTMGACVLRKLNQSRN